MSRLVQLSPGAVLGGDFRIEGLLGAGGMGAVYVAEQLSTGRQRALKVMHPQLIEDEDLRRRFVREARVGALIESDHVVEVVGAGIDDDTGMPWIAMELLEGEDLGEALQQHGFFTPKQLSEFLEQLCHALGAAHSADVVHRDIKPENIFVTKGRSVTSPRVIKVLDFGIAKMAADAKTTVTAALGSPAWMAPEQTDPRARISPATDVWAIGLLSFWLLTGRFYWSTAADPHSSVHAMMKEILFEDLVSASERARELGVEERLPPGFDAWFQRCVTREIDARFPDAMVAFEGYRYVLQELDPDWEPPPESAPLSFARGSTMMSDLPPPDSAAAWLRSFPGTAGVPGSSPTDLDVVSSAPTMAAPSAAEPTSAPPDSEPTDSDPGLPPSDSDPGSRPAAALRMVAATTGTGDDATAAKRMPSWLFGALALLVAAVGGLWFLSRPDDPPVLASAASAPPPVSAPPTGQPSSTAVVAVVPSVPDPVDAAVLAEVSASVEPTAATTAPPPPPPPPKAHRPFNTRAATAVLKRRARIAGMACSAPEPRAYTATVYFRNSGSAHRVTLEPRSPADAPYFCARSQMFSAVAPAYDGPEQSLAIGVALKPRYKPSPQPPKPSK